MYVTNQTKDVKHMYVRVRSEKQKESEKFNHIVNETSFGLGVEGQAAAAGKDTAGAKGTGKVDYHDKDEEETKERRIYSKLIQEGFSYLPLGETMPFPVENDDYFMYLSVHDGDKLMWYWDMIVYPRRYGCITIKGDREGILIRDSNPKPRWVEWEENDSSFSHTNLVEVKQRSNKIPFYLGIAILPSASQVVCEVWQENGKFMPTELSEKKVLSATKYEWVKVERGNHVPANAVRVSVKDGSQHEYLGRADGDRACGITEVNCMFDQFISSTREGKKVIASSGEVLLLTAEPIPL